MQNRIGFVFPFFNEENRFDSDFIHSVLVLTHVDFIFVDDGSTDDTYELLTSFTEKYSNLTVLRLPTNVGKAEAIRHGWLQMMNLSEYEYLGFMDSDGAITVLDLVDLLSDLRPNGLPVDAIWKSRVAIAGRKVNRSILRHFISRIIATVFGLVDRSLPYDTQCGLKLFKVNDNLANVLAKEFETRWFIDLELYTRLKILCPGELHIWEIPCLTWHEIPGGQLTLSRSLKLIPEMIHVFVKLWRVRKLEVDLA